MSRDQTILKLNSLGYSLGTIADKLNCHTTTVTNRLSKFGIPAADTRRTFMEDVYDGLSDTHMEWLSEQLGPTLTIKDFVRDLIAQRFVQSKLKD